LQSSIEAIEAADAQVLALCADPVEENAKVVEKLKLDFPILADPDKIAIQAYGLLHKDALTASGSGDIARPAVFILDRQGIIRWRQLTDNWRVRVRPETIIEKLAEIP
jgi:peroxiredoxin Q/BCP